MIRNKQTRKGPIIIDLTGTDGNAFALLGYAKRFTKQLGLEFDEISTEMTSGNYENLLEVFDEHFGDFVILER